MTRPAGESKHAVLVTGASGGIGRAISLAFAAAGWSVGVHYHRNKTAAEDTLTQVVAVGGVGALYEADIRESHAVQQMVEASCRQVPVPSVFICNAGIGGSHLLLRQDEEDWAEIVATNLTGTFHCLRAMAPPLLACGGGSIVVIGSHAGFHGSTGQAAYAASKAGLIGLVNTAAQEWGAGNVRVNLLLPGWQRRDCPRGPCRKAIIGTAMRWAGLRHERKLPRRSCTWRNSTMCRDRCGTVIAEFFNRILDSELCDHPRENLVIPAWRDLYHRDRYRRRETPVTSALVAHLTQRGVDIGVMKPIETGVSRSTKAQSDGARLRRAAGSHDPIAEVCPYVFRLPVAPLSAARAEGTNVRVATILRAFGALRKNHDLVAVEGVGGVHVPITGTVDLLDLVQRMGLPVIIVGQSGLGGVNHALLTLHALRQRKIPIVGLILNQLRQCVRSSPTQEQSTVTLLRRLAKVPVVGPLPFLPSLNQNWNEGMSRLAGTLEIRKLARLVSAFVRESS